MKRHLPLRQRVALAYGLVGLFLSLCFALSATFVAEDYEHILIEAILEGQASDYLSALSQHPDRELPRSPGFSVYREQDAPPALRGLDPGVHEIALDERDGLHAAAFGEGDRRLVMLMDVGQIEALEVYLVKLMVVVVLAGTAVSAWLGWHLAGRTVAPVLRLAETVDGLPVTPVQTRLADGFGDDEIGRLAGAIDHYQGRLSDADAKEREFFADASHELRTPIAVIQGAVEVMRDDTDASQAQRARLARMDRGLLELAGLLEALLLSGRGLPEHRDPVDLADACRSALQRLDVPGLDAPSRIVLEGDGPRDLVAPSRWVDGILSVLFQRLLAAWPGATWSGVLDADGLHLHPATATARSAGDPVRSDLGIGLVFVERLCRALGWQLEQRADEQGLQVRLRTTPPR